MYEKLNKGRDYLEKELDIIKIIKRIRKIKIISFLLKLDKEQLLKSKFMFI